MEGKNSQQKGKIFLCEVYFAAAGSLASFITLLKDCNILPHLFSLLPLRQLTEIVPTNSVLKIQGNIGF